MLMLGVSLKVLLHQLTKKVLMMMLATEASVENGAHFEVKLVSIIVLFSCHSASVRVCFKK